MFGKIQKKTKICFMGSFGGMSSDNTNSNLTPSSSLAVPTGNKRFSKEELQKRQEMEQDRKTGIGPLLVNEDGRGFTTQVPHFISKTPWYVVTHQQQEEEGKKKIDYTQQPQTTSSIYQTTKQRKVTQTTKKYREGSCDNCGSITHRTKECLERPRKIAIKYSIEPNDREEEEKQNPILDEVLDQAEMNFDTKRDRWKDYDPDDYKQVIEDWKETNDESEEEEKQLDESCSIPGQKVDLTSSATRMTVRNLRMREDVAKYLYNLDDKSSDYDPKTRSMRSTQSNQHTLSKDDYLGGTFVKPSDEVSTEMKDLRLFAWECHKVGETDIHMQANPTLTEMKFKEQSQQKELKKKTLRESLLEKYGDVQDSNENPS